jgi:hypothetical protein
MIKILEIKIDNLNIDLSDKVYYYAKILKDNKKFICQMVTDGITNKHMDLKEWTNYIELLMTTRKKGSGSKENVGRHKLQYNTKRLNKTVPAEIYDLCLSLIDAECLKFKIKL